MAARYASSDVQEDSFPSSMPCDLGAPVDRRQQYPKYIQHMRHLAKSIFCLSGKNIFGRLEQCTLHINVAAHLFLPPFATECPCRQCGLVVDRRKSDCYHSNESMLVQNYIATIQHISNQATYLAIFILNFCHPCSTVVNQYK
jgi:hypothetical protein